MLDTEHPRLKRRVAVVAAAALAFTTFVALSGTAGASATQCDRAPGAQLGFKGTFSNGSMKLGSATGSNLGAQACGSVFLDFVDGAPVVSTLVQPTDIAFSPVSVKILFLSLPATITVNAPLSGPIQPNEDFSAVSVKMSANISASASLLGFNCVIGPITPTLTTGKSGSMTGQAFSGALDTGFAGRVVANDFAVPAIKGSKSCPSLIAGLSNVLVGLPAAPGKASISMDGAFTISE